MKEKIMQLLSNLKKSYRISIESGLITVDEAIEDIEYFNYGQIVSICSRNRQMLNEDTSSGFNILIEFDKIENIERYETITGRYITEVEGKLFNIKIEELQIEELQ